MKKINGNEAAPAAEPADTQPAEPAAPTVEVNQELVVQLERMLIDAKAGALKAVAAACLVAPGQFYIRVMAQPGHLSDLHSGSSLLCFRILQSWAHVIDAQVQQAVAQANQQRRGLVAASQMEIPPELQKMFRK